MPTYEYNCTSGHHFERFLPVADYQTRQTCDCGASGRRIISVPLAGYVQRECRYDSPVDGRPITSWAARRDDMARNNCQEYDPAMRQDVDRFHKRAEAALDKAVEATVEETIEKMPARKKEALARELDYGATPTIERTTKTGE